MGEVFISEYKAKHPMVSYTVSRILSDNGRLSLTFKPGEHPHFKIKDEF